MARREFSSTERLKALAKFAPLFASPDFEFGHWNPPTAGWCLPDYEFSETASSFVHTAYDLDWVLRDFDWGAWQDTDEARRFCDDPRAVAEASAEQLAKLLTLYIRGDRFCDGALAGAFESGLLSAIVNRAAALIAIDGSKSAQGAEPPKIMDASVKQSVAGDPSVPKREE